MRPPLSPQAARGVEEDLRVHDFSGHVAVAVTPAGEGDDDAVGQDGQGVGDELLLQLVGGGQVPEQPWSRGRSCQAQGDRGAPRPARANEPADTSPPSRTWSVRPTVLLLREPISQRLRWTAGSLRAGFWNPLSRARLRTRNVTKKHGQVDILHVHSESPTGLYFPPAVILETSVTQPTVEDAGTLPLRPPSARRVSWPGRVPLPLQPFPPFS